MFNSDAANTVQHVSLLCEGAGLFFAWTEVRRPHVARRMESTIHAYARTLAMGFFRPRGSRIFKYTMLATAAYAVFLLG